VKRHADDLVSCVVQARSGDGRVDAAAHCHEDAFTPGHGSLPGRLPLPTRPRPAELIALRAGAYRYGEAVDLVAGRFDHATTGLKTIVQGP
jgi:hypothetical protein